jgi:4a-hydroxytetrahydrobiopterin dehydratase
MNLNEINEAMSLVKDWSLDTNSITKNFAFPTFKEALDFVNKVGEVAEKHNHHPDVLINHNQVRLILTTHSLSGLSRIDFEVAKEIDKIDN